MIDVVAKFFRMLAAAGCLLLVSCIDGREEFWLNADGSGRADITYSLPAAAARFQGGAEGVQAMVEKMLANAKALTHQRCEVTTKADRLTIHVSASFRSVRDLKTATRDESRKKLPPAATHLAGKFRITRDGRAIDFTRTISAGRALSGSAFMPASQFKGRNLRYIVHLPVAAGETNATRVSDGGRTLSWDFPLAQAIKGPVDTRFTATIPIPAWVYGCAGGLGLTLAAGTFLLIRKIRGSRQRVSRGS